MGKQELANFFYLKRAYFSGGGGGHGAHPGRQSTEFFAFALLMLLDTFLLAYLVGLTEWKRIQF